MTHEQDLVDQINELVDAAEKNIYRAADAYRKHIGGDADDNGWYPTILCLYAAKIMNLAAESNLEHCKRENVPPLDYIGFIKYLAKIQAIGCLDNELLDEEDWQEYGFKEPSINDLMK